MAEWFRAPAIPPCEVGGASLVPDKVGFEIDSFFDLFFHIVHCNCKKKSMSVMCNYVFIAH